MGYTDKLKNGDVQQDESSSEITFIANLSSSKKQDKTNYKVISFKNGKFSIKPPIRKQDVSNCNAFCYILHKSGTIIPNHLNKTSEDRSDYLFIARDSCIIEVIRDYQYKLKNGITLKPSFILVPSEKLTRGNKIIQLEFSCNLLYYVALTNRKVGIFILHLPDGYLQQRNFQYRFLTKWSIGIDLTVPMCYLNSDSVILRKFYNIIKYFGNSSLTDICFFLSQLKNTSSSRIEILSECYQGTDIYSSSVEMGDIFQNTIKTFQLNPVDPFSFLFSSCDRSNTYKILLGKWDIFNHYIYFLSQLIAKKKERYLQVKTETLNKCQYDSLMKKNSKLCRLSSINDIIQKFPSDTNLDDKDTDHSKSILLSDGIYHPTPRISMEFLGSNGSSSRKKSIKRSSTLKRRYKNLPRVLYRTKRLGRTPQNDLVVFAFDCIPRLNIRPENKSSTHNIMLGSVLKSSFVYEQYPELLSRLHDSEKSSSNPHLHQSDNTNDQIERLDKIRSSPLSNSITSSSEEFLEFSVPDTYKNLLITVLEPLKLNIFSMINETPSVSLDIAKYVGNKNTRDVDDILSYFLVHLTQFKKIIPINPILYLILDVDGLLLVNVTRLDKNYNGLQIIPIHLGIIQDSILIIKDLIEVNNSSIYTVVFQLIVTVSPGDIFSFNCVFEANSPMGKATLLDKISLKTKELHVDTLTLINYSCELNKNKRSRNEMSSENNQRKKLHKLYDKHFIGT